MIKKLKKIIYSTFFTQPIVITTNENLKNTVVVIAGASRGIGKAIATVLAQQQASLILVSRHKKDLQESFKTFSQQNILLIDADITQAEECKKIIEKSIRHFGKIDVVINNAGRFGQEKLEMMTDEVWDKMMSLNIDSLFYMCKAVIPHMKKQHNGFIINIGSNISHNTNVSPYMVAYATIKYAVEGFSFALNKELKPFGIRVSCLMPVTVNTVMSKDARQFLSPYSIGKLIAMMIAANDIDFEAIIVKSKKQNI